MATIFLLHGSYGDPNENWFPWLKKELEKENHKVITPTFPTPENQSLATWTNIINNHEEDLEGAILIGHSLAAAFILKILQSKNKKIRAAFVVAGWTGDLNNPDFDTINKTFTSPPFNWEKIKQQCKHFILFNSDNDPYVPLKLGQELAKQLDTTTNIVTGAGHFNKAAGYETFPLLLEKIKQQTQN